MDFFNNKYPYTDMHELNAEFLIKNAKDTKETREAAEAAKTAAELAKVVAQASASSASVSEQSAKTYSEVAESAAQTAATDAAQIAAQETADNIRIEMQAYVSQAEDARDAAQESAESIAQDAELIDQHTTQIARLNDSLNNIGNPIINKIDNIFIDPFINNIVSAPSVFSENLGWEYIGDNQPSIERYTLLGNMAKFEPSTISTCYIAQDISKDNLSNGDYTIKCKIKSSTDISARIVAVGYPNSGNIGGTTLSNNTFNITNGEFKDYILKTTISNIDSYDHVRIYFQFNLATFLLFTEPIMSASDVPYSYIGNIINTFMGKKLGVIGDSIMYGAGSVGGFAKIIADNNYMNLQNIAVTGGTICSNTHYSDGGNRFWIAENVGNLSDDCDYILIEGGFNDYANNVSLNESAFTNSIPLDEPTNYNDIYNAMNSMCWHLVNKYHGKKVGFVFPHKILNRDTLVNTSGYNFKAQKELMKKVLTKYGIPYIDLSETTMLDTVFTSLKTLYTYNGDGVHPNDLGYRTFYVNAITKFMQSI